MIIIFFLLNVFQSWDSFFRNSSYQRPPSLALPGRNEIPATSLLPALSSAPGAPISEKVIDDHLAVQAIIRSYQVGICRVSLFFFWDFAEKNENILLAQLFWMDSS